MQSEKERKENKSKHQFVDMWEISTHPMMAPRPIVEGWIIHECIKNVANKSGLTDLWLDTGGLETVFIGTKHSHFPDSTRYIEYFFLPNTTWSSSPCLAPHRPSWREDINFVRLVRFLLFFLKFQMAMGARKRGRPFGILKNGYFILIYNRSYPAVPNLG